MHGQWSNPTYAEVNGKSMVIFPGGDGWIYAFNPNSKGEGELLWKFDCNPKDFLCIGTTSDAKRLYRDSCSL